MDEETSLAVPGTSGLKVRAEKSHSVKKTAKAATSTTTSSEAKKKTTLELVCEAIKTVGVDKKGASAQAIRKYILSKNESSGATRINVLVNKALVKGIEKKILSRPNAKKDVTGATGHFILVEASKPKNTTKPIEKKQVIKEHASDSEITEKPTKQKKRTLSDTFIEESKTSTPKTTKVKRTALSKDPKGTKKAPVKKQNMDKRKDSSDTEIVVKKKERKSMKSYSSDTDVDFVQKKTVKKTDGSQKKTKAVKRKEEKSEPPPKISKAKAVKKLYNSSEEKVEKDQTYVKTIKTRAKKQT